MGLSTMANDEATKGESRAADGKAQALVEVRALARLLRQYDLSELEVETEDARIVLKRTLGTAPTPAPLPPTPTEAPAAPGAAAPAASEHARVAALAALAGAKSITSPFVGTFYRAASPDGPPFVEVGQTVRKGQTLCIIEAMKLMNEIEAELDVKILEVLVKSGEPVEFGQALFRVEGA